MSKETWAVSLQSPTPSFTTLRPAISRLPPEYESTQGRALSQDLNSKCAVSNKCNHWVVCHFKTISWVQLYWLTQSCHGRYEKCLCSSFPNVCQATFHFKTISRVELSWLEDLCPRRHKQWLCSLSVQCYPENSIANAQCLSAQCHQKWPFTLRPTPTYTPVTVQTVVGLKFQDYLKCNSMNSKNPVSKKTWPCSLSSQSPFHLKTIYQV